MPFNKIKNYITIAILCFFLGYQFSHAQHQRMIVPKGTYTIKNTEGKINAFCFDNYLKIPPKEAIYTSILSGKEMLVKFVNDTQAKTIKLGETDLITIKGDGTNKYLKVVSTQNEPIEWIKFDSHIQLKHTEDKNVKLLAISDEATKVLNTLPSTKILDKAIHKNAQNSIWANRNAIVDNKITTIKKRTYLFNNDLKKYSTLVNRSKKLNIHKASSSYTETRVNQYLANMGLQVSNEDMRFINAVIKDKNLKKEKEFYKSIKDQEERVHKIFNDVTQRIPKKLNRLKVPKSRANKSLSLDERLEIFKTTFQINSKPIENIIKDMDLYYDPNIKYKFYNKDKTYRLAYDVEGYQRVKVLFDAYSQAYGVKKSIKLLNTTNISLDNTLVINIYRKKSSTGDVIKDKLKETGFEFLDVLEYNPREIKYLLSQKNIDNVIILGHYDKDIVYGFDEEGAQQKLDIDELYFVFKELGLSTFYFGCESAFSKKDLAMTSNTTVIHFNDVIKALKELATLAKANGKVALGDFLNNIAKNTNTDILLNIMNLNMPSSSLSKGKRIKIIVDDYMETWEESSYGFEFIFSDNLNRKANTYYTNSGGMIMLRLHPNYLREDNEEDKSKN